MSQGKENVDTANNPTPAQPSDASPFFTDIDTVRRTKGLTVANRPLIPFAEGAQCCACLGNGRRCPSVPSKIRFTRDPPHIAVCDKHYKDSLCGKFAAEEQKGRAVIAEHLLRSPQPSSHAHADSAVESSGAAAGAAPPAVGAVALPRSASPAATFGARLSGGDGSSSSGGGGVSCGGGGSGGGDGAVAALADEAKRQAAAEEERQQVEESSVAQEEHKAEEMWRLWDVAALRHEGPVAAAACALLATLREAAAAAAERREAAGALQQNGRPVPRPATTPPASLPSLSPGAGRPPIPQQEDIERAEAQVRAATAADEAARQAARLAAEATVEQTRLKEEERVRVAAPVAAPPPITGGGAASAPLSPHASNQSEPVRTPAGGGDRDYLLATPAAPCPPLAKPLDQRPVQLESEQAEKERKEAEVRERAEREAREAKEAQERATREAEKEEVRREEEVRAEIRAKTAREREEKRLAEERARVEAEEAARREAAEHERRVLEEDVHSANEAALAPAGASVAPPVDEQTADLENQAELVRSTAALEVAVGLEDEMLLKSALAAACAAGGAAELLALGVERLEELEERRGQAEQAHLQELLANTLKAATTGLDQLHAVTLRPMP